MSAIQHPPSEIAASSDHLRESSRLTDPQSLINAFRHRVPHVEEGQYWLSLSRRGLEPPWYRITRHTKWGDDHDPWKAQDRLPLLDRGLLGHLIYGNLPAIVDDLNLALASDDPGREFLEGSGSLLALPQYDAGEALNMVVRMSPQPHFFRWDRVPDFLIYANVLGKAVSNSVLSQRLERAYSALDHEFALVGKIQRALLPGKLPHRAGLQIAVSYETAAQAGGDYYDFFELPNDELGFLIADVGGHGPIAAVVMAMMRTMLHATCTDRAHPAAVMEFLNRGLQDESNERVFRFTTAFYGVFDLHRKVIRYSCAGHCPPILVRNGAVLCELDAAQALPLGVMREVEYHEARVDVSAGDLLVLYTDGVTETVGKDGQQFGVGGLKGFLEHHISQAPDQVKTNLHQSLNQFALDRTPADDRTLVIMAL